MVHFTLKFVWGRYGGHSILSVVAGSLGSWSYCIARKQGKIFDAGTQLTSSFFFFFLQSSTLAFHIQGRPFFH